MAGMAWAAATLPPAQAQSLLELYNAARTYDATYLSAKNGQPQGQYCAMYTQPWDKSLAKNTGQYRGNDHYTIGYAFSYSNDASPGLPVCPSDIAYLRTAGADFCTSFVGYQAPSTTVSTTITTFPPQTVLTTATTTVTTKIGTTTVT